MEVFEKLLKNNSRFPIEAQEIFLLFRSQSRQLSTEQLTLPLFRVAQVALYSSQGFHPSLCLCSSPQLSD